MSCTSKCRCPSVRLAASRQVAKAAHQDVVERGAVGDLLLERLGARPQRLVGEPLELLLQRVDLRHARQIALDPPLVGRAKQLAGNGADHAVNPSWSCQVPLPHSIKSDGEDATRTDCRSERAFIGGRGMRKCRTFERRSCKRRRLRAVDACPRRTGPHLAQNAAVPRPDRPGLPRDRRGSDPCQLAMILLTFSSKSASKRLPSGAHYATVRRRRRPPYARTTP